MDTPVPFTPDDVQVIENVLDDAATKPVTRTWLLRRAALGVAAAGVLTPAGSALAATRRGGTSSVDSIETVINTAVTAEALAVTFLSGVIKGGKGTAVEKFIPVLKAANQTEFEHYKVLKSLGAKPLTTKFWAPNALFGANMANVFKTLEYAETLFVNAYLIGITSFAAAGKNDYARYAGEILGTEAEHRALARFAQGKLPNNVAFEDGHLKSMTQIVAGLQKAGVGFGKQGKGPGKFYEFPGHPLPGTTLAVASAKPR